MRTIIGIFMLVSTAALANVPAQPPKGAAWDTKLLAQVAAMAVDSTGTESVLPLGRKVVKVMVEHAADASVKLTYRGTLLASAMRQPVGSVLASVYATDATLTYEVWSNGTITRRK
jgi:hypothetical protein